MVKFFVLLTLTASPLAAFSQSVDTGHDSLIVKGRITEQLYQTKKGAVTNIKEYYFVPDEEDLLKYKMAKKYFIKLPQGSMLKNDLLKNTGKQIVLTGVFQKGLWDVTNGQQASRVGYYVTVLEIKSK